MRKIDLIIPVHNLFEMTKSVIKNIEKNTNMPYRIILIDNGSTDATKTLESGKNLLIIRNKENKPFSIAVNQGLERVEAPYFGILNNDIKIDKDCFEKLIWHLKGKIELIGPLQAHGEKEEKNVQSIYNVRMYRDEQEVKILNYISKEWSLEQINKYLTKFLKLQSIPMKKTVAFFCAVMKTDILKKYGNLHPDFVHGGEDEEYCRRIEKAGNKFSLALDVCIRHYGRRTFYTLTPKSKEEIPKVTNHLWNMELLYRLHPKFYLKQGYVPKPNLKKPDKLVCMESRAFDLLIEKHLGK